MADSGKNFYHEVSNLVKSQQDVPVERNKQLTAGFEHEK